MEKERREKVGVLFSNSFVSNMSEDLSDYYYYYYF